MAHPERFELPTDRFVADYSIQLSYGCPSFSPIILTKKFKKSNLNCLRMRPAGDAGNMCANSNSANGFVGIIVYPANTGEYQLSTFKGIILAGGTGSRLYPMTTCVNKQLLPVYDKPMIYYPLTTLMSAGIREILIISGENELPLYRRLLGDGSQWGLSLAYKVQPSPDGLAQALILGEEFLSSSPCALILGDNMFFSADLHKTMQALDPDREGSTIFAYKVNEPERYGVVEFDQDRRAVSIEEKPKVPKSHFAVTGLYFYDRHASEYAKTIKPSARGELEITDLNMIYLKKGTLNVEILTRGSAWLDTGTPESLLDASDFVRIIESRQGMKIGCPEETAFKMDFIDKPQLLSLIEPIKSSNYGKYLARMLSEAEQ